jgi:hypothetical protein
LILSAWLFLWLCLPHICCQFLPKLQATSQGGSESFILCSCLFIGPLSVVHHRSDIHQLEHFLTQRMIITCTIICTWSLTRISRWTIRKSRTRGVTPLDLLGYCTAKHWRNCSK